MNNAGDLYKLSHRRFNPLTGEWILVSPNRTDRPWRGHIEPASAPTKNPYDPDCYLCPGNERAGGERNPKYASTFVFTNDFAALKLDVPQERQDESGRGLTLSESEHGTCRVVCFSPRHDLTLARMTVEQVKDVVDVWVQESSNLSGLHGINYVQIFENRGEVMGCSNPHPHGQIWANHTIPNEPLKEQRAQQQYLKEHGACLLCEYLQTETEKQTRVVLENDHFVTIVPFWALWPFEVVTISKQHLAGISALDEARRRSLAEMLRSVTIRYDNLFQTSFPYSMGFHQAPADNAAHPEWHLHAHFYPPLLRSATIRKFMVGYELLAGPQRDITAETAAETLRKLSNIHYLDKQ